MFLLPLVPSAGSVMKQSVASSPSTTSFHNKTVPDTDAKLAQDYMSRQEQAFLASITLGSTGSGSTGSTSAVAAGLKSTPYESSSQNKKKTTSSSSKKQQQHAPAGPQRVSPTLSASETIIPDDNNSSFHKGPAAMPPAVIVPTVLSLATLSHWDIAAIVNGRNLASCTFQYVAFSRVRRISSTHP
jgi:hypothetical protein